MKEFFGIKSKYQFEWGDLRALVTIINVALIMVFGLSVAWFGLAIAICGVVRDLVVERHINGLLLHLASIALNIYFIILLYA